MFQAEVVVQAAGGVLLDDELQARARLRFAARGLGRFVEVALAFVFFEAHGSEAKPQADASGAD